MLLVGCLIYCRVVIWKDLQKSHMRSVGTINPSARSRNVKTVQVALRTYCYYQFLPSHIRVYIHIYICIYIYIYIYIYTHTHICLPTYITSLQQGYMKLSKDKRL